MGIRSTQRGGDGSVPTFIDQWAIDPASYHTTGNSLPDWHRLNDGSLTSASLGRRIERDDPSKKQDIDYRR